MKIQTSIRKIFEDQYQTNARLRMVVDQVMAGLRKPRWHYESRLKEIESFAIKLETGRVEAPEALEDFLACMIVVSNSTEIEQAVSLVSNHFEIKERRPSSPTETRKSADAFPFDDLRLYCSRAKEDFTPPDVTDNVIFEIQIKTFLQHAWAIATHDLSYKTDEVSWGKDRIVAHLKASIEYAEVSIQEARSLAKSPVLALQNARTNALIQTIGILKKHWETDLLPSNLRSLAQTIVQVVDLLEINADELDKLLSDYRSKTGSLPQNLSPYGGVIMALISEFSDPLDKALRKSGRVKLLLTPEIDLPPGFPSEKAAKRTVVIA
jgi:ppGpp synthetase/RelA/SpoT-type nucleotidyltranferase